jgi:hypothetical protein
MIPTCRRVQPRRSRVSAQRPGSFFRRTIHSARSSRPTAAKVIDATGGIVGAVKHPINTPDFSSFLLQAQSSKAQVVALADAGGDLINAVKQAGEYGITRGQKLAGLIVFIADIDSLGLQNAQGLMLSSAFYWDLNDGTRVSSKHFIEKTQKVPTMIHAGTYGAVMHYLGRSGGYVGWTDRCRKDARNAGERFHDEEWPNPPGRPAGPRHVSVPGQIPGGVQIQVRLLQAAGDHHRRRGLQADGGRWMSALEDALATFMGFED